MNGLGIFIVVFVMAVCALVIWGAFSARDHL